MAKKVAVVGGSGNLGREVIDEILARASYEVVILSRGAAVADLPTGVVWKQVDYDDETALIDAMQGIDTVLSFLAIFDTNVAFELHKKLINAAIEAGVRRFAPSEWATASNSGVAHYKYKDDVRRYLEEVNSKHQKIEYCLFQPGFFTDYFAHPHAKTKHFNAFYMFADFQNRRAIISQGCDAPITLTTVRDMSRLVAEALEYDGAWPTVGGPFKIEEISREALESRNVTTSWYPVVEHHGVPEEMREQISKGVLVEYVAGLQRGVWTVSDEWNKLLPEFKFTSAESYLSSIWT